MKEGEKESEEEGSACEGSVAHLNELCLVMCCVVAEFPRQVPGLKQEPIKIRIET